MNDGAGVKHCTIQGRPVVQFTGLGVCRRIPLLALPEHVQDTMLRTAESQRYREALMAQLRRSGKVKHAQLPAGWRSQ